MPDTVYCHYCHIQHPREEMRLVVTKTGKRWRCSNSLKTMAKAVKDIASRDSYGREKTDANKAEAKLMRQAQNTGD
jgi:hypothetical protein